MADANLEWCICGHHDRDHDVEQEPGNQDCRAPGCKCLVFRPTGEGMPEIVLLNEYGTGLDEEGNVIEEELGSVVNTPVDGAEEFTDLPRADGIKVGDFLPPQGDEKELPHGEAEGVEAEEGRQENQGNSGETEIGTFDERGQEIEPETESVGDTGE